MSRDMNVESTLLRLGLALALGLLVGLQRERAASRVAGVRRRSPTSYSRAPAPASSGRPRCARASSSCSRSHWLAAPGSCCSGTISTFAPCVLVKLGALIGRATLLALRLPWHTLPRWIGRLFGPRLDGWLPLRHQRRIQRDCHGGVTAQQVTPAQIDLGPSLAFASQPEAVGIDSDGVIHAVDGDLPFELFGEDGGHVRLTPLRETHLHDERGRPISTRSCRASGGSGAATDERVLHRCLATVAGFAGRLHRSALSLPAECRRHGVRLRTARRASPECPNS